MEFEIWDNLNKEVCKDGYGGEHFLMSGDGQFYRVFINLRGLSDMKNLKDITFKKGKRNFKRYRVIKYEI